MAFIERALRFTFSGAPSGSFSATGLRAIASIQQTDGLLGVTAQVKIWGLTMAQMNNYSSTIPNAVGDEIPDASLVIEAGDSGGNFSQVIDGPIWSSFIDLTDVPESAFVVSVAGIADAATPTSPQYQRGTQNAESLISSICAGAGLTFNNNGAHQPLSNPNFYGSAIKQIDTIARAANFNWARIGDVISIWPKDGSVDDVVIDLGPGTEPKMVDYPAYYESGLIVASVYNPQIQVGRQMNIVGSSIVKANGPWQVTYVQHELSSMIPKGPWFTTATLAGANSP